jgi:SAM-dependent MidA family methyltransferase
MRFDEVVDLALYHPEHGFYATGAGAGRGRDFLTSPEVGLLFGAVLARALDRWWDGLGRPDPYVVAEAGAGSGALARSVLAARPACLPALRYVLVERSPVWRARLAERLPVEPPVLVLGAALGSTGRGTGPVVTLLPDLPAGEFDGVVVANELLDNLAFRLLEREGEGWAEVRVGEALEEVLVPAPPEAAATAAALAPEARAGARVPLQSRAAAWLRSALGTLRAGRVVVVDYADTTAGMAARPWTEWVRTYRDHGRGGHPLAHLGEQDVTCEVAVDQLARVRPPSADRAQAEFLAAHGLEELAGQARQAWRERAHVGDLQALRWRSRAGEAAALADPAGLGAFRVLEWAIRE